MKSIEKMLLLVEDDPFVTLAEKTALEEYGYAVKAVSTGEAAVDFVDSCPETDLILMDIDLGEGIDGTEAAELILAKHDIPVIFISSHTEPEIVEKTEKITSYGYIVKHSSITVIDASIKMAFKLFDSKKNELTKENALQDSERSMKNIVASSPMGIHMYELRDGDKLVFTGYNKAADRILGIDHTALVGKTIEEAFPPLTETEIPYRYRQAALHGESWTTEQIRYNHSDISGAFEVYAFQTSHNRMAVMFLDVTERTRALQALRESEAMSQTYFEKSVVGMALVSMDRKFIDCNEAFCRFTGFTKEEVQDKTIADITWPEDLEKGYAEMKQLTVGAIQSATIEKRYVNKQGALIWGELNICFIRKESTGSSFFLASIVDITDRKKAETGDKQLIAEKEMLLREVHHRIKNNLNTINALLVLQAGSLTDQNAINALEEAGNRVRSMELLYEKIYAATDFSEVNLGEYLPPLIDDIISNFPNHRTVSIRKSITPFPVQVKQLQPLGIIVNELLTNIMKYAFVGKNDGIISISATLDRNRITVTIEDNGNGMPESVSFEHSTGFGLVLVNGLTKQLGGTIRIERGNGTRIVLEFDK